MPEAWATLLRLPADSDEYGRWLDRMAEASPAILDDISNLRHWLSDDGDLRGMLDRLQNDLLPLEMAKIAFDPPDDVDAREMQDNAVKVLAFLLHERPPLLFGTCDRLLRWLERATIDTAELVTLAFNVFAPFVMAMEAATGLLTELIPGFHGVVTKLGFEHSPGRGKPMFLADHSAFDVFFEYRMADGKRGFVAIEIKYSECMREPVPSMRPRYDEVSAATGLYIDPDDKALRSNPLQQLWREHMLSQCLIENGLYEEGSFVLIAPRANHHVQEAAVLYESHLAPPVDGKARFVNLTLDDVVEAIRLTDPDHASALHRRYLDFWLVDGEIELHEPVLSQRREKLASPAASAEQPVGLPLVTNASRRIDEVPVKRAKRAAIV
jgi:hypothetical protein